MKLFLSSIGFDQHVSKEIDRLVHKKRGDVSIGIVVNAKKYKTATKFKDSIKNNTKYVTNLGYSKIHYIDLDSFNESELECDVLYILGGNSFYLLGSVRRNDFDKKLKQRLDEDGIVIGQSAGAILFSPSIETADNDFCYDENIIGLKDLDGLKMVNYAIFPHYEDRYKNDIANLRKSVDYDIYAIKDGQTILLESSKTYFLGGDPQIF